MNDNEFSAWMKRMDDSGAGAAVPEADAVWWRAQLRRRLAEEERATRPLRIAERMAYGACIMAEAVLAAVLTMGRF